MSPAPPRLVLVVRSEVPVSINTFSEPLTRMVPPLLNEPELADTLWMRAESEKVTWDPVIVISPPLPSLGNSNEWVLVSILVPKGPTLLMLIVGAVMVTDPEFPVVDAVDVSIPELVMDTLEDPLSMTAPPLPPPEVPVPMPLSMSTID